MNSHILGKSRMLYSLLSPTRPYGSILPSRYRKVPNTDSSLLVPTVRFCRQGTLSVPNSDSSLLVLRFVLRFGRFGLSGSKRGSFYGKFHFVGSAPYATTLVCMVCFYIHYILQLLLAFVGLPTLGSLKCRGQFVLPALTLPTPRPYGSLYCHVPVYDRAHRLSLICTTYTLHPVLAHPSKACGSVVNQN